MAPLSRTCRSVLATLAAGSLVGCSESAGPSSPHRDTTMNPTDGTGSSPPGTADLDLREANVTAVTIESRNGDAYRLAVTLYHDDDGEEGYADWWQVERLDGTKLGRRTLLHAYSTAPFTRKETIQVPDGVSCVVVRGHDQQHGYGGQVAIVTLETGATRLRAQGSETQSLAEADCP